jgi:hypothetical protein
VRLRLRAAVILTVFASLALSTAAQADGVDVTQTPIVQRYLSLAAAYWGTTAPCPAYVVEVAPLASADPADAEAAQPGCSMRYGPETWQKILSGAMPRWGCLTTTHEYGHSLGHGHVADPNDIMNEHGAWTAWESVPGCTDAFPEVLPSITVGDELPAAHHRRRCHRRGHHRCLPAMRRPSRQL